MSSQQHKAEELIWKFLPILEGWTDNSKTEVAKQCALICVEECIKRIRSIDGYASRDYKVKPTEDLLQLKQALENGSF